MSHKPDLQALGWVDLFLAEVNKLGLLHGAQQRLVSRLLAHHRLR